MGKNEILDILRDFVAENGARYHIVRLGIFGSAARDEMRDESDIDVVVELEKPELSSLVGIKRGLEERLHRRIDLIRYRREINPTLKICIDREAVYV